MMPTASAVVADIIDVALGNSATTFRHLQLRPRNEINSLIVKIDDCISRFYIRLMAKDQPVSLLKSAKYLPIMLSAYPAFCSTKAAARITLSLSL